ncbi:MAG: hypothetical protein AAF638_12285 [Pseudomonadota bacterium]
MALACGLGVPATVNEVAAADLFAGPSEVTNQVARLPAVSGFNGSLSGMGGVLDEDGFAAAHLSLATPVPFLDFLGVQVDGLAGTYRSDNILGGALHIFARHPSWGMIGAYGDWGYVSPQHYGRVGPELEIYMGRFSLEAIGGMSFGQNVDDEVFVDADLAAYATDDFRLSVGYTYSQLGSIAKAGLEYQVPLNSPLAVSLFAEGRIGEEDYAAAWAGLKIYGAREQKSLIRRHREDLLRSRLPSNLAPLTNCGIKTGEGVFCGSDDDFD